MSERIVTLHGAFYGRNFGDLLLLQLQLFWLAELGISEVRVPTWEEGTEQLIEVPEGLHISVGRSSEIVFGGGGYLGSPGSFDHKWLTKWVVRHGRIVLAAAFTRTKLYFIGTGVGPLPPFPFNLFLKRALRRAEVVMPRDRESGIYIESLLGAREKEKIDVGTDLVVALAGQEVKKTRSDKGKKILGLHLAPPLSMVEQYGRFVRALGAELRRHDFHLRVLVDQNNTPNAGQQRRMGITVAEASNLAYEVKEFENVNEFVGAIAECDRVITSKLHVGIVARCFEVGVFSVANHLKTIRFYRQIGELERCRPWGEQTVECLLREVVSFLKVPEVSGPIPEEVVEEANAMKTLFSSAFRKSGR